MPECGSQVILCDVPVRFDTYSGCSHGCQYCFATRKIDISQIRPAESCISLGRFIAGHRTRETSWCDWSIPVHWGGMSDPFQPCEATFRRSVQCLELLAQTSYPVVFSTKGRLAATPEYTRVMARCNIVGQVSMVSPAYDALEPGAPPFKERLDMIGHLAAACKRVIARVQPYTLPCLQDVLAHLKAMKQNGAYGLVVEGIKCMSRFDGCVKVGADWVYPRDALRRHFQKIKDAAHEAGLVFLCGENRLRSMGDSLTCCGCEGLAGFKVCKANLNHHLFGGGMEFTPAMSRPETAQCFKSIAQDPLSHQLLKRASFADVMSRIVKTTAARTVMGQP